MQVSDQRILKAVRAGLKRLAAEPDNAHLLSAIDIAVNELAVRSDGSRLDSLRDSCVDAKRLAQRGAALLGKIGGDELSSRVQALPDPNATSLAALNAVYVSARQLLVECLSMLGAAADAGKGDAAWRGQAAVFFREVAKHDAQRAAADLQVDAMEDSRQPAISLVDRLKPYFATHAGTAGMPGPFDLIDATQISGGFSRQTILVKLRDAHGEARTLVVRKQVPGGFLDGACNTLAEELPYFKLGHQHGLPVPELYWHETDANLLDGEFFVTECMSGTTIGSSYQMAEGVGEAFFRQLAEMMATLHRIDWTPHEAQLRAGSRIPSDEKANTAQAALAMVKQFDDYWRRAELEPLPTMELLVDWLKRNVPSTDERAVLCHGDIGFHNLLVQDGRITALLDWETSRLADPARDLSYLRPMVTQYVDWNDFMAWYRDAGGVDVAPAALDYYAVFAAFAHVIVCEVAMGNSFPTSARPDLEYLRLGLPIKAYFFNELMQTCGPVWAGAGKE